VRSDRRKDFEYRVACQASHQGGNKLARAVPTRATARLVKGDTTRPIPHQQVLQVRSWDRVYTVNLKTASLDKIKRPSAFELQEATGQQPGFGKTFFDIANVRRLEDTWCPRRDSNPEPTDYESAALTVELQGHIDLLENV
jgi:hypothetical protein